MNQSKAKFKKPFIYRRSFLRRFLPASHYRTHSGDTPGNKNSSENSSHRTDGICAPRLASVWI
jgi:hypothetical protein